MLKRVNFLLGNVESIDFPRKEVIVSHGFDHQQHSLTYDHLVIGLGSITNLLGIAWERALLMKSLGDLIKLRNHLIEQLEEADSECVKDKNALLTFVVVGGGLCRRRNGCWNQRLHTRGFAVLCQTPLCMRRGQACGL